MADRQWIWGRRPVLEALRSGRAKRVLMAGSVRDAPIVDAIREAARQTRVPVETVDSVEVKPGVRGRPHQGVIAEIEPEQTVSLERLMEIVDRAAEPALLVVLDQIQDPHNLGSLLRSADELGAHGAIITQRHSAGLSGVVAKTSAGASHHVATATVGNLARALDFLKRHDVWSIALDPQAKDTIAECDLRVPVAIVVGSEGQGIRRLTSERVDLRVRIPTSGHLGSLNASVSGAIALYEAVRQRQSGRS